MKDPPHWAREMIPLSLYFTTLSLSPIRKARECAKWQWYHFSSSTPHTKMDTTALRLQLSHFSLSPLRMLPRLLWLGKRCGRWGESSLHIPSRFNPSAKCARESVFSSVCVSESVKVMNAKWGRTREMFSISRGICPRNRNFVVFSGRRAIFLISFSLLSIVSRRAYKVRK